MAETKGRKVYAIIAITDIDIIGLWSNLSSLVRDFNKGSELLSYSKIYRMLQTHLESDDINNFNYDFIYPDGKKYAIKVKILK